MLWLLLKLLTVTWVVTLIHVWTYIKTKLIHAPFPLTPQGVFLSRTKFLRIFCSKLYQLILFLHMMLLSLENKSNYHKGGVCTDERILWRL